MCTNLLCPPITQQVPLIIKCPHCESMVLIDQLNCRIFRHGVFKSTGIQINPHLSQSECERLFRANQIYGCGRPFRIDIINNNNNNNNPKHSQIVANKCGYI